MEALIVGTLTRAGDRIRCTVSLVEGRTGLQFWADEFEEPAGDIFGVQRRIATGVAAKLKGRLTGQEEQELAQPPSRSVEAYDLYLRCSRSARAMTLDSAPSVGVQGGPVPQRAHDL